MTVLHECPSVEILRGMLAGDLSAEQVDQIGHHLEGCALCRRRCEGFDKSDTILESARGVQDTANLIGEVPEKLKHKLKAMGELDEQLDEDLGFLAPAERADELGRLGGYRILKVLGQGGMGIVFQAEDIGLQRAVALKVMLPRMATKKAAKARFLREAQAAAAIEHDHIVAIHQVGEDRGVPFIAMPMLKGSSLEDYMKKRKGKPHFGLSIPQIVKLGREMAKGLQAAHERGLVHRDIKPSNIWLDSSAGGRVKILDFGLARPTTDEQGLTSVGAILGTPAYMAPEQASGEHVDFRADLFSLGVVLYRLCTGKSPFQGTDIMSTLMSLAVLEPPAPIELSPDLPPALSRLIVRLMAKKPSDRFASAKEVVQAFATLQSEETVSVTASVAAKRPSSAKSSKPSRVQWAVIAGGLFAGLLLALSGVVFFIPSGNGTLRVEVNDPEIEVSVKGTNIVLRKADKGQDVTLTAGEKSIVVSRGDFSFETDKLLLKRGETVTVKVDFLDGKVKVSSDDKLLGERAIAGQPEAKAIPPKVALEAPKADDGPMILSPLRLIDHEGKKYVSGATVQVAFDVTNASNQPLAAPIVLGATGLGTVQAWIERLGDDATIDAIPATTARQGRKYAAGGIATKSPPMIAADYRLPVTRSIATKSFPPGKYRYFIEYKPADATLGKKQTQSIDFELLHNPEAPPVAPKPAAAVKDPKFAIPVLAYAGHQDIQKDAATMTRRYHLRVVNFADFDAETFKNVTVKILDEGGRVLYGFTALEPVGLTKLWFTRDAGAAPRSVRIEILDRVSGISIQSNVVELPK